MANINDPGNAVDVQNLGGGIAPHENFAWNVIGEDTFRARVEQVFELVANALAKTLGPYGAQTILEKFGEMCITKDGWNVLKQLNFNDEVNNNILHLLVRISGQVVSKVGDGSTSSIVAANCLYKKFENDSILASIRPKELVDHIAKCVNMVSTEILKSATKITNADGNYDEIYHMAHVSTNGDVTFSEMIRQAYKETNNPSIEFVRSKTHESSVEIVDGYKLDNASYLDTIYATQDDGSCVIDNPIILMFDHKIDTDTYDIINRGVEISLETNRRLVIIAPNYDSFLLERIRQVANSEIRSMGKTTVVYCVCSLFSKMTTEYYNDFSVLCGADIIHMQDAANLIESLTEPKEGIVYRKVEEYIGTTNTMTITGKAILTSGFPTLNENMFRTIKQDAAAKYEKELLAAENTAFAGTDLYEFRKRVSKLTCKMAIINVGGYTGLEKQSNYDMVEDAVRACESGYGYGYNIGGNLIIPHVIKNIMDSCPTMEEVDCHILNLISDAFKEVFGLVLKNGHVDKISTDGAETIIDKCVNEGTCFNLVTGKYSKDIINSCLTDIEILKAAASTISLLLASNQYVSIRTSTSI